jgi:hypothetical protein
MVDKFVLHSRETMTGQLTEAIVLGVLKASGKWDEIYSDNEDAGSSKMKAINLQQVDRLYLSHRRKIVCADQGKSSHNFGNKTSNMQIIRNHKHNIEALRAKFPDYECHSIVSSPFGKNETPELNMLCGKRAFSWWGLPDGISISDIGELIKYDDAFERECDRLKHDIINHWASYLPKSEWALGYWLDGSEEHEVLQ